MVINSRLSWWKISSRCSTLQFERPISDVLLCFQEGAFDEAVKGVDAIEHTASPFHTNVTEPEGRFMPKGGFWNLIAFYQSSSGLLYKVPLGS